MNLTMRLDYDKPEQFVMYRKICLLRNMSHIVRAHRGPSVTPEQLWSWCPGLAICFPSILMIISQPSTLIPGSWAMVLYYKSVQNEDTCSAVHVRFGVACMPHHRAHMHRGTVDSGFA
uniref:Uncharacterized protein n=1 Tax=Romanomermis culicivorax TaxID=13658 RepID=A0A915KYN5_ROMCU